MDELLPCPFCGHTLVVYVAGIPPVVFVQCGCCGASGPAGPTRIAAVAAWNRRPPEQTSIIRQQQEEIERLRAQAENRESHIKGIYESYNGAVKTMHAQAEEISRLRNNDG